MENNTFKNLSLAESFALLQKTAEIPLYKELLRNILLTIGVPKLITADYTIRKDDRNNVIVSNSSSALTVTIPLNLDIDNLDYLDFEKLGSGNLTISAPAGVSINGTDNPTALINADTAGVRLRKVSKNTYKLVGTAIVS